MTKAVGELENGINQIEKDKQDKKVVSEHQLIFLDETMIGETQETQIMNDEGNDLEGNNLDNNNTINNGSDNENSSLEL